MNEHSVSEYSKDRCNGETVEPAAAITANFRRQHISIDNDI